MNILVTFVQFIFRISSTDLQVIAGVLNNTVESLEETKVVREVTDVFIHEEFDEATLINDIAILKVGIIFKHEKQIFYIPSDRKHTFYCNQTLLKLYKR
jgi:hypothetical protein